MPQYLDDNGNPKVYLDPETGEPLDDRPGVPKAPIPEGLQGKPPGMTGIDPHQMPHSMADVGVEGIRALSNIGAGGIGALETMGRISPWGALADHLMGGPTIYEDAYHALQHPVQTGKDALKGMADHPLETLEQGVGAAGAGAMIDPEATFADKIPSKTRAINTLNEVSKAAKDVPVQMAATDPAVQGFRQYVATGGRGTPVVNKLVKRMASEDPVKFPEGRQFYTNISRATAKPGFLRRAIESPAMPDMRRNLGGVRESMSNDLTNAAKSVGLGDKYTQGIREYSRAAKLHTGAKVGAAIATEEALRRSGLLGKMASGAANLAGR